MCERSKWADFGRNVTATVNQIWPVCPALGQCVKRETRGFKRHYLIVIMFFYQCMAAVRARSSVVDVRISGGVPWSDGSVGSGCEQKRRTDETDVRGRTHGERGELYRG